VSVCWASFDINTVFSVLFGIGGTLSGIGLGYFISKRLRRSDRLIESIYEPLLSAIGQIHKDILYSMQMPDRNDLQTTKKSAMYYAMDNEVKEMEDIVYRKLKEYQTMFQASGMAINKIIEGEVEKVIANLKDAEKYRNRPYDMDYRPHIAGVHVGHVNLRECVRIGKTPIQFIKETATRTVEDSDIDCLLAGYPFERRLADSISESTLKSANENSVVKETRALRNSLLEDLQKLIEKLTKKVVD